MAIKGSKPKKTSMSSRGAASDAPPPPSKAVTMDDTSSYLRGGMSGLKGAGNQPVSIGRRGAMTKTGRGAQYGAGGKKAK
jgi:hypothetical protein